MVHDSGKSHYKPTEGENLDAFVKTNTNFLVFSDQKDTFDFENEYKVELPKKEITQVYEYFWAHDNLEITTRVKDIKSIIINTCPFKLSNEKSNDVKTLECALDQHDTKIEDGHVTKITGTRLWAFIKNTSTTHFDIEVYNVTKESQDTTTWKWFLLNSMTDIEQPEAADQKWIRGVQGTSSNLVIQYSHTSETVVPSADSDSSSTIISFDLNYKNNIPSWSANIHNNNIYNALVGDDCEISVSRISGEWWMAKGENFGETTDNML